MSAPDYAIMAASQTSDVNEGPRRTAIHKALAATCSGVIVLGTAIGGLGWWLTSDWYHDPGPYPTGWAGFTPMTFIGLCLFNMLTAVGYVLLYIGITTGARITRAHPSAGCELFWMAAQGVLATASIAVGCAGMFSWGTGSFMNCAGVFCVGDKHVEVTIPHPIRDSAGEGWLGVVGVWAFFVLVPVGLILVWRTVRRVMADDFFTRLPQQFPRPDETLKIEKNRSRSKVLLVFAFIATLVVIFFYSWITFWLPDDWEYFTDARFASAAKLKVIDPADTENITTMNFICNTEGVLTCPELPWAFFKSSNVKLSDDLYLKLFPSNLFFFCYLLGILAATFVVTHTKRSWAEFWAKPMPKCCCTIPTSVVKRLASWGITLPHMTRGEIVGFWITKWLIMVFCIYWIHDHNYDGNWNLANSGNTIGNTNSSRWARSMGQLAVLLLSLLLFAGSRQSMLHRMLGTSWEAFIWAHKALGYGMLLATFLHIAFWWKQYSNWSIFPGEIFQLPPKNPEGIDNFTIPLIFITTIVLFIAMGIFAMEPIRRRFFELFYYTHLFAAWTTIPVTLWHAASGWEYMLPGLTVWLIDRLFRASRSAAQVHIISVATTASRDDDQVNKVQPARSVEIKFVVDSGALHSAKPGQYVFINVPEVSLFEWHPFTLSHCPMPDDSRVQNGNYLSLHIKSMGPNTWTDRLFKHVYASSDANGSLARGSLSLAVDGPCGAPFQAADYTDVVLLAGGIGITPCACIFDHFKRARVTPRIDTDQATMLTVPRQLRLVWALREEPLLHTELRNQLSTNPADEVGLTNPMFPSAAAKVFLTRHCEPTALAGESLKVGLVPPTFACGRPNIVDEINEILCDLDQADGPLRANRKPVVFVCGPEPLVEAAQNFCEARGVPFHRETFLL